MKEIGEDFEQPDNNLYSQNVKKFLNLTRVSKNIVILGILELIRE
jgi:hypothetical protein